MGFMKITGFRFLEVFPNGFIMQKTFVGALYVLPWTSRLLNKQKCFNFFSSYSKYTYSVLPCKFCQSLVKSLIGWKLHIPLRQIASSRTVRNKEIWSQKNQLMYPEQQIKLYTCENLYKKWREERRFWCIPKSGVTINVPYIDTSVSEKKDQQAALDAPVVLCIHGIPGNYNVFSNLITYLGQHGIRVIVPNFPESLYLPGKYKSELFRHTGEEKTQLLKDFIKALNIPKIDCIVAHSSAIYPCLGLSLNDTGIQVMSQALFNVGGHRKTNAMSPYWLIWLCSYISFNQLGHKLLLIAATPLLNMLKVSLRREYAEGIILLAVAMVSSDLSKAAEDFKEIARRQLPTLFSFSEDDRIVERDLSYDIINLLSGRKNDIWYYDDKAKLKKRGAENSWLKIMSFEAGSHYVFRKHPEVNNEAVLELVMKVQEKSYSDINVCEPVRKALSKC